jgi:hypothetical protein
MKTETKIYVIMSAYCIPRAALTLETAKKIEEEMQYRLDMMGSNTLVGIKEVILEN